jgi:histidinol dehydrogenase
MKIVNLNDLKEDFFEKIEFENITSVSEIIADVRENGDSALIKYSKQFGDGDLDAFELSEKEIIDSLKSIDMDTLEALNFAIKNVRDFAQKQLSCLKNLDTTIGKTQIGHRLIPVENVGCYIPGGNYPLMSSAIMTIVPAKVAGVKKIVAISPKIHPYVIAACKLSGADRIFRIGGVQGIAALAYSTESVPKVDKIVGPGNKYVTAAKKQVFGECGIDFLAGPSEVLIIADDSANPDLLLPTCLLSVNMTLMQEPI